MSFNLVDLVKGQLGGPALGQLGALLGEDNNKTEAAVGAAVPGLLSGLTSAANADGGASLFNAVRDQDDSLLDNIGGLLTGGNSSNVMNQGSNLLGSILGNGAAGGLASAVAGMTGIGGRSSSGLMGLLMPIVLGMVKRKIFGGGGFSQNAGGLLSLLNGQNENIQAAMPQGFQNQLQSSGFMDNLPGLGGAAAALGTAGAAVGSVAGNVTGAAGDAMGNVTGAAGDLAGNVRGAAGDAIGNVTGAAGDAVGNVTGAVGNVTGNVTGAAGDAVGNVTGAVGNVAGNVTGAAGDAVGSVTGAAGNVAGNVTGAAGNVAGNVTGAAGNVAGAAGDAASSGGGLLKKILPAIGLAILAFLGLKMCGGTDVEVPDVNAPSASVEMPAMPAIEMPEMPGLPEGMSSGDLGGAVSEAQSALGGITDVDSAKAALPALDGLTGMLDKVPEAARGPLSGVLGGLTPLLEKASAIPGVGDVLAPIAEKLQGFM